MPTTTWARRGRRSAKYHGRKVGVVRYPRTRKRNLRNKTSVPVGLGFPKRMVMTHRYTEQVPVTSTLGVIGKYQFSCNGMFDPNITGTGHQPMYFDQMSALYNHYTVIGSKLKITVSPSVTNEDGFYTGCYLDDDTTTSNITDITAVSEATSGKIRMFSPNAQVPHVYNRKWSAKKTFGGSVLGNDNLQGTPAGNPSEQTYYTFAIQSFGADTTFATLLVEYTFIAVWEELKQVAQS